uniref:Transcription factor domain-containing protein n=1 Tax=Fusarium oxysporum (strain Fo5176) TaxID=660025 RepID=A0A0D2XU43_FUSOF
MRAALSSHVQTLERRVTELEAALLQMRSEIKSSTVSASTPTVNLTSPYSTLRVHSDASSFCISPYSQQDSAGSGNTTDRTPTTLWTCLGQHWYFKGIPINSAKGREWIFSKVGENISLDGFRLFGSQAGNSSTSSALFNFPDRHAVEESLKSYFSSPGRLVYPTIDPVLIEEVLLGAYADSQHPSPEGKASSQACILAFMAMNSRLRGAHAQSCDGDVYVLLMLISSRRMCLAATALFLNILIHPLDQRARSDLDILAGCTTLFQDMAMEELTNDDMDCIHELNRFVSELVRLGSSAIWKAKREWKSATGISS